MEKGKFVQEETTDYFFYDINFEILIFTIIFLLVLNTILLIILLKKKK